MSASLHLSGVAASFGARPLFSGLDLTVAAGDVIAVVGPNGAGKSTLLRMIAGEHSVEIGHIAASPPDAAVGFLPQTTPDANESIVDYAGRRTGVSAAYALYEAATEALAAGEQGADTRFAAALDRWLALGGADLDVRLAETLARLGFEVDLERPLGTLSGGQAARAALASVLVSQFDVLLLDEPTNNLDADGLAELTAFVRDVDAPVLIASHDRSFVDAVATAVLELDLAQQRVQLYPGGWSDYREAKALGVRHQIEEREAYEAQRDALVSYARKQDEWARMGRVKVDREVKLAGRRGLPAIDRKPAEDKARKQDQKAARARAAVKRLDAPEPMRKEWRLQYSIAEAGPPTDVVVALDTVTARTGDLVVGPVSTNVRRGSRVALMGPNGSGKSTLLRAILSGEPTSGRLSWGARTVVGVLDQDRSATSGDGPLLEVVMATLGSADAAETRTLLAKFGLGAEHVLRPCSSLSLGERTRAALAVLQGRAVNVLVLDEPTNHADVEAIEQLQRALESFGGTLLLVTHDAALLDALDVDATWTFCRHGATASVHVAHR